MKKIKLLLILFLIIPFVNALDCPPNAHISSYGKCQCNKGYFYREINNMDVCEKLRIIPQIKEIPNWTLNLFFFVLGFGLVQFSIWNYFRKLKKPKK